jgi:pimeloyl-ACP methyl ester carboxylesterase
MMRAREPDVTGHVNRDGVRIYYDVYGSGPTTILILPTWSVLDSAHGRFQLVDLSRHYRVVTFDGRGNGRSDRPQGRTAYAGEEFVADAVAVLDATDTATAVVLACSLATHWLLRLAAEHPERVLAAIASGTNLPLAPPHDRPEAASFDEPYWTTEGWAKFNAAYWREDYEGFLRFFFSQVWIEPHSETVIDACVANGLETTAETLIDTIGTNPMTADEAADLIRRAECPWLVVHGDGDQLQPLARAERLAEETKGSFVTFVGAGHCSGNRDPVRFNLLIREFTEEVLGWRARRWTWTRARSRSRRVVMVPAGPGTLNRDMETAAALRQRFPDLRVEWLAAEPASSLLLLADETVHPASADLPPSPERVDDAFAVWRQSDEVHFLTFMILHDIAAEEPIDLVVADGAWGIDHHLHENPELKRFAYAWLTDAIGWIPEPGADERRRFLMADANAEMLEQVEHYPRIRDRALYLGEPSDLPDAHFGAELPVVSDWAARHFTFTGPMTEGGVARAADRLAELL